MAGGFYRLLRVAAKRNRCSKRQGTGGGITSGAASVRAAAAARRSVPRRKAVDSSCSARTSASSRRAARAPFALAHPGGEAADDHAEDQHHEDEHEQRQGRRVGRARRGQNGSNDTVTACRLATAKATMTTTSGTTMMAVDDLAEHRWCLSQSADGRDNPGHDNSTLGNREHCRATLPVSCSAARAFPCRS